MALYENIFIVRQDVSSTQVDAITDSFEEIIREHGGSVAKREYWGLRTLAYRIKKNKKGHYVLFNIDAPSEAVQELARQMRLHEDILRELTVRLESLPEAPSPIMLTKGDRDRDRASRDGARAETEGDATTKGDNGPADAEDKAVETKPEVPKPKADTATTEADAEAEEPKVIEETADDESKEAKPEKPKRAAPKKTKASAKTESKVSAEAAESAVAASDAKSKPAAKSKRAAAKKPTKAKAKTKEPAD